MTGSGFGLFGKQSAHAIKVVDHLARALEENFSRGRKTDVLVRALEHVHPDRRTEMRAHHCLAAARRQPHRIAFRDPQQARCSEFLLPRGPIAWAPGNHS
jgi:hypothetical protein